MILASPRERLSLNADWRFQKNDPADATGKLAYEQIKDWILPTGNAFTKDPARQKKKPDGNLGGDVAYTQPGFDDRGWRKVNLPHDWAIEGPFDPKLSGETGKLPCFGVGWYRKRLDIPASDAGRALFLEIDGAMAYSAVWCNGRFVGGWPYGYTSYQLDLTPYLHPGGDNTLAIRLDNPKDSSRWYPGAGIYRNVWLTKTSPVHIAQWGVYVTTPEVSPREATVAIRTKIVQPPGARVSVATHIYELDAKGKKGKAPVAETAPAFNETPTPVKVKNPKLWSCEHPNLYVAVTSVTADDSLVDQVETIFGIRTIKFDADNGFLLNGQRVQLKGICLHHDLGALGTAFHLRAAERQLEILKEMGINALRTSHNMPAPEQLDLCDRLGILVMDESFDCWTMGKTTNDYCVLFEDWHEMDLRAQIRRDHNHPSVILYSIGNEIPDQSIPGGIERAARLTALVHEEDPTRPTTVACDLIPVGYTDYVKAVDVFGYNYKPGEYAKWRLIHPHTPFLGSETAATVSTRGEYFFPLQTAQADHQVSSYDLWAQPWATLPDTEFKAAEENSFVAGQFVWTGFDYLGEPKPYDSFDAARSSYFGIVDLAGFKKDRFYLYQALWRPELPMAHLLPHWNWPGREGEITPVLVYTSGDEAELFVNGVSQGRKKKGRLEYRLRWNEVKYAPGELKAVAYKDGKVWANAVVKTTGPAAKLVLQPDHPIITADGQDLSFVTVTIADPDGLLVPRSKNLVKFELTGPGEIVATDNGDPTSLESFQAPQRKAFNGLALVVIRSKRDEVGVMTLQATSEGLHPAATILQSVRNPGQRLRKKTPTASSKSQKKKKISG